MRLKRPKRSARQRALVESAVAAYTQWRGECAAVRNAYRRWVGGPGRCSSSRPATPRGARRCFSPRPCGSAPRGEKHAVRESRWLWVDVDQPGQLRALWALLAERPCHMLVESGGSGGAHAYWKIAKPLAATRVVKATGELVEPIERANLRLVHRLGVGADGKPDVADPACAERSQVMRLAGTVNGKIRGRDPHGEDPARRTRAPLLSLGSVPVTRRTPR